MPATHRLTRREFKYRAAIVTAAMAVLSNVDKHFWVAIPAGRCRAGAVHTA
jgi:hypothetical protein